MQKSDQINKGIGLLLLLLLGQRLPLAAQSKNYAEYNWYFGNSTTTLLFNKSDAKAQLGTGQHTPYGIGGGVVISDPVTGNLLFYTDGEKVYDRNHQLVPNGGGLKGSPGINRAAVVVPLSYVSGRYLIFTNPGAAGGTKGNEILYTEVNKTSQGQAPVGTPASGEVVAANKNQVTGLTNPSEAMIVIQKSKTEYWLITQDRTTFRYRVLRVNAGKLGTVINFEVPSATPSYTAGQAVSFAYHAASGKLAVARDGQNVILLNFDVATGALSFNRVVFNTGNAYDVAWSADGENLYVSLNQPGGGGLYHYHLPKKIINPVVKPLKSYGIQRGPDDKIYHLYELKAGDPIELGIINKPNESDYTKVDYQALAFDKPAGIHAKQFPAFAAPNFLASDFKTVDFSFSGVCTQGKTQFSSSVDPPAQSYQWDFGDGKDSDKVSPVHTYAAQDTKSVTLTVTLNGATKTVTKSVKMLQNPLKLQLVKDTVRCVGEGWELDAKNPGSTYAWRTPKGEIKTTQKVKVDTTGIYSVAVTAPNGCMSYAYSKVKTYGEDATYRNKWYFGDKAGMDFNPPSTQAITDGKMSSNKAAATMSDLNGQLLFYTNGETIWNAEHQVMNNGNAIGGSTKSSQGVMIVPLPRDTTLYYVFTTDEVYGDRTYDMRYSVVDMKRQGMKGEVVAKDQHLFTNSTERIAGYGIGKNSSWLVTHEFGNNVFRAYPITKDGIGTPVTSIAGSVMSFGQAETARGEMDYAASGGLIALAFQGTAQNYVELFKVDNATGNITLAAKVDLEEPAPARAYGVEISPSKKLLYVSTNGAGGSKLVQYQLDSLNPVGTRTKVQIADDIKNTRNQIGTDLNLQFGALQTGPDGVIYMAVDGQSSLGTINNANSATRAALVLQGFDLKGWRSKLDLPRFVQNIPYVDQKPALNAPNVCLGSPTDFKGAGTSIIDVYAWKLGDGTTSDKKSLKHTYKAVGDYDVTLNLKNRCKLDTTLKKTVSAHPLSANPETPDAVAMCNSDVPLTALPRYKQKPGYGYTWSTGAAASAITNDSPFRTFNTPGMVTVVITNRHGCKSKPKQTLLAELKPNFGGAKTYCQNIKAPALDAHQGTGKPFAGTGFRWTMNDKTVSTAQTQSVSTATPGRFTYLVKVTSLGVNCLSDPVVVTIDPLPKYTLKGMATTGCGKKDGSIDIDLTSTGNFTYAVGSGAAVGVQGPAKHRTPKTLKSGGYLVKVIHTTTKCELSKSVTVGDGGDLFTINRPSPAPACPGTGQIDFTLGGIAPGRVTYSLRDARNAVVRTAEAIPAPPDLRFSIGGLNPNTYSIIITEKGGKKCKNTLDNIVLGSLPEAKFSASSPQRICGAQGKLSIQPVTANTAITYAWLAPTPSAVIGSASGVSITATAGGNYTVTASATGYCPVTHPIVVTKNPAPSVSIEAAGAACDGLRVLTARTAPLTGSPSYTWENGANTATRTVNSSGSYTVRVADSRTGCEASDTQNIVVYYPIKVSLAAAPNCDNNPEVWLTATANIRENVAFQWTGPTGALPDKGAKITIRQSGNYQIKVSSTATPCHANAQTNAIITPIRPEDLKLKEKVVICNLDPNSAKNTAVLDPGAFKTYAWRIVNQDDVLSSGRVYRTTENGVYEVSVTNGSTCIKGITEVTNDCLPRVHAPNAFTPGNSDGKNDVFFVYPNPYVSDFNIQIFSRWGELLYQSSDINFKWNGTHKGVMLPVDTYAYVIRFKNKLTPERGVIKQRGGIALLR